MKVVEILKMKKLAHLIAGALGVVLVISFFSGALGLIKGFGKADIKNDEAVVNVETKVLSPETMESYINISSKISANNEIKITPKVSGTVKVVHVQVGDVVKSGDVLFEIDDTAQKLQAEQASAQLSQAQASYDMNVGASLENQILQLESSVNSYEIQYKDLLKDLDNAKVLYPEGAISKHDLDTLQSNADKLKLQLDAAKKNLKLTKEKTVSGTKRTSQAAVTQAQVSLKSAQTQLGYTLVKAEINGVISSVEVSEGMAVNPQSPSVTIVDAQQLKVKFNLSDDHINRIGVGSKAYVQVDSSREKSYNGSVLSVSPAADSKTQLYPVELKLIDADATLKPGMFASIKLVVSQKSNTIAVPVNALIDKGDERYVFCVNKEGKVIKKAVKSGVENDEKIEIINGLNFGDQVIIKGQSFVKDGAKVSIKNKNQEK